MYWILTQSQWCDDNWFWYRFQCSDSRLLVQILILLLYVSYSTLRNALQLFRFCFLLCLVFFYNVVRFFGIFPVHHNIYCIFPWYFPCFLIVVFVQCWYKHRKCDALVEDSCHTLYYDSLLGYVLLLQIRGNILIYIGGNPSPNIGLSQFPYFKNLMV